MSTLPNREQIVSLLRTILQALVMYALGKGWIKADDAQALVSLGIFIGVTVWGLYGRRDAALVASAAAVPSVVQILTDAATATAVPSDKVQPAA